jgi:hypothetical protein
VQTLCVGRPGLVKAAIALGAGSALLLGNRLCGVAGGSVLVAIPSQDGRGWRCWTRAASALDAEGGAKI